MSEDWFEVAFINLDKVILHGRRKDGVEVEIVLTDEQKKQLGDLRERQMEAEQDLLRSFAG